MQQMDLFENIQIHFREIIKEYKRCIIIAIYNIYKKTILSKITC